MSLQLYDVVRIARLTRTDRLHEVPPVHPPAVGDSGTVVDIPAPGEPGCPVTVEAVADDGRTLWLAEFDQDELELVE